MENLPCPARLHRSCCKWKHRVAVVSPGSQEITYAPSWMPKPAPVFTPGGILRSGFIRERLLQSRDKEKLRSYLSLSKRWMSGMWLAVLIGLNQNPFNPGNGSPGMSCVSRWDWKRRLGNCLSLQEIKSGKKHKETNMIWSFLTKNYTGSICWIMRMHCSFKVILICKDVLISVMSNCCGFSISRSFCSLNKKLFWKKNKQGGRQ